MRSIILRDWYMFSFSKNIKRAYTLAEVVIVMLIIAVVVAISIKITKAKFDHITSYTYYSAFSTVRNVTAEMLNDFNAEDETYTSHEGLLAKLLMNKAYGEQDCLYHDSENCYLYKIAYAAEIFSYNCQDPSFPCAKDFTFSTNTISKYVENVLGLSIAKDKYGDYNVVHNSMKEFEDRHPLYSNNYCAWYRAQNECLDKNYDGIYAHGSCFSTSTSIPGWEKPAFCEMSSFRFVFFYRVPYEKDPVTPPVVEPICPPKTCTGGNVFDNTIGVCDCVCKATPPETIPCGKEWSAEQCQLVDKADFSRTCPAGQRFDNSDDVCDCKPIKPSIPIKGANYCKLFASYSNTAQLPTECSGSKVNAATAVFGGDDANVLPDLILRNGMVIYNASQNPTKIAALDGNSRGNIYTDADGNEFDLDEWGYTLYIDIDGNRSGNGVLWEDVYPFYVTLSGMTIPAYNSDNIDMYGGGNKSYLQVSLQDEYTNNTGRHVDWLLKSKSFRESACQSGYVSANSDYCKASPALTSIAQCSQEGHDCRLKYVSPYSLFKK